MLLDLLSGIQRRAGRLVAYKISLYAVAAGYVVALRYPFGGDEEATVGQRAMPVPPVKSGLPQPDWDSGDVFMTPLAGSATPSQWQWHTWSHNLNSMNLLVDAKLGGVSSQGQMAWSLTTETLFALTDPNKVTFRWTLDEEVWGRYQTQLGLTGPPRLRVWI